MSVSVSLCLCLYLCLCVSHSHSPLPSRPTDEKIEVLVYQNIMAKFAEKIPAALEEQGVQCSVHVVAAEDQAEYFFDAVEALGLN